MKLSFSFHSKCLPILLHQTFSPTTYPYPPLRHIPLFFLDYFKENHKSSFYLSTWVCNTWFLCQFSSKSTWITRFSVHNSQGKWVTLDWSILWCTFGGACFFLVSLHFEPFFLWKVTLLGITASKHFYKEQLTFWIA